ncbi:MAG: hypothetical protein HY342_12690 [Candidatus Lambdaproteobacteria bacterium]|nr:hypothetical protein [Candidatus Lambdaproteobacteria bacterium]
MDDADGLRAEAWRSHLTSCRTCRREVEGFERSLALYRALEAERLAQLPTTPSWDRFAVRLEARTVMERRLRTVRVPVAAAVAGLLVLAGTVSWSLLGGQAEQQSAFPLAGQTLSQGGPNGAAGQAGLPVPVVVEQASFARTPSASERMLRASPFDPSVLVVDDHVATRGDRLARYARRTRQLPWVGVSATQPEDLVTRPFLGRYSDAADRALLAPLTPLNAGGGTAVNFASYASDQRR